MCPEIREEWRQVQQRVLGGAVERAEDDLFARLDGTITYNRWESKLAEQALRESEERYRVLFECMLEGWAYCQMIYDEAGRTVDWDLSGGQRVSAIGNVLDSEPRA